jgi:hypothetical protein
VDSILLADAVKALRGNPHIIIFIGSALTAHPAEDLWAVRAHSIRYDS